MHLSSDIMTRCLIILYLSRHYFDLINHFVFFISLVELGFHFIQILLRALYENDEMNDEYVFFLCESA